jgi:hypothetical protein
MSGRRARVATLVKEICGKAAVDKSSVPATLRDGIGDFEEREGS